MMNCPAPGLTIDPGLVHKYNTSGPRYTSYPTADRFAASFGEVHYRRWLARRGLEATSQPLSLYVHLPFCHSVCYYCGCNKVVTRDRGKSARYTAYLAKEIGLVGSLLAGDRCVSQMHWGGGTPTSLARDEMVALIDAIHAQFDFSDDCECSIEVDPRSIAPGMMAFLAGLGFNRVSIGVQDFDPAVQKAVNRVQTESETRRVIDESRASSFRSVSLDLIYGLPKQTLTSFDTTLDCVLALDPDRVALYSYAHLPNRFKPQRRIAEADLPSAQTKLQILTLAIARLTAAGYNYIGMDHFAKPADDLAIAQQQGRLQRNFQGYSTHAESDMLGFGISAIGRIGPCYSQNRKDLDGYYAALDDGQLPVAGGIALTRDDMVRRAVIQALACQFSLTFDTIERAYALDFARYFAPELQALQRLEQDGLVQVRPAGISVTPKGRLLVRIVCMVFDRHLREGHPQAGFSKVM
jgi:oxygen-independent coproporphyrinogen-3 oxidase